MRSRLKVTSDVSRIWKKSLSQVLGRKFPVEYRGKAQLTKSPRSWWFSANDTTRLTLKERKLVFWQVSIIDSDFIEWWNARGVSTEYPGSCTWLANSREWILVHTKVSKHCTGKWPSWVEAHVHQENIVMQSKSLPEPLTYIGRNILDRQEWHCSGTTRIVHQLGCGLNLDSSFR